MKTENVKIVMIGLVVISFLLGATAVITANSNLKFEVNSDDNTVKIAESFENIADDLSEAQGELDCLKGCLGAENNIKVYDIDMNELSAIVDGKCLDVCSGIALSKEIDFLFEEGKHYNPYAEVEDEQNQGSEVLLR